MNKNSGSYGSLMNLSPEYIWIIICLIIIILLISLVTYYTLYEGGICCQYSFCNRGMKHSETDILFGNCNAIQYNTEKVSCFCFRKKEYCSNSVCAICIDDYIVGENLLICPCGHGYHKECLRQWLRRKNVCPLCKVVVSKKVLNERTPLLYDA